VDLRHKHIARREPELTAALAHMIAHRRLPNLGAVLVHKPAPDPLGRMALLARRLKVRGQPLIDQRAIRTQLRRRPTLRHPLRRRHR
jgi:hypothetical protein